MTLSNRTLLAASFSAAALVSIPLATPAAAQVVSDVDVARSIAGSGFGVYRILNREPGRTMVEACRNGRKFRLAVRANGRVRNRGDIGRCDLRVTGVVNQNNPQRRGQNAQGAGRQGVPLPQIRQSLRQQGFNRIEFTDRELPGYGARVCDGSGRQLLLRLNRRGEIRRAERTGRCARPVTAAQLEERLRNDGLLRVGVTQADGGFAATVCEDAAQVRIEFDRYGQATGRQRVGRCESRTVQEIFRSLRDTGASNVTFQARGCINGTRYRWTFNRRGDGLDRTATGSC